MSDRLKKLQQVQQQASDHSYTSQDNQTTRHSIDLQSDFNQTGQSFRKNDAMRQSNMSLA